MLPNIRSLAAPLAALALAFGLAGCGVDDSSVQARLEKAQIAIDAGDYTTAKDTLLGLCGDAADLSTCPDNVLALLGEAYMGLGGVDVLALLDAVDLGASPTTFDLLVQMLGTDDPANQLSALQDALDALAQIPPASRTADQNFQYAVAAASHAAMAIVDATYSGGAYDQNLVTQPLADTVAADLEVVLPSADEVVAALGGTTTQATTDLNDMVTQLGGSADAGNNVTLTSAQLHDFVATL